MISVALATYNGARFLSEQLASLAGQTLLPSELVVSDDGSTDDTLAIVDRFAKQAPFPVVWASKGQRRGFADNFLHAAESCSQELIAFCDQDDVWLPNKLEVCAGRIREDDSLMVLHTLTVTDARMRPTGMQWMQGITDDRVFEPLELDPFATGWGNSMLFRRDLITVFPRDKRPRQPFFPERPLSHDTWIYILAAALGRVSHVNAPLLLYRQHDANAAGLTMRETKLLNMLASIDLASFREQAQISRTLAALFEEIGRSSSAFAEQGRAAAESYEQRSAMLESRAGIFDGSSVASRFTAYRRYHDLLERHRPDDPSRSVRSRVKALALGVANLRRALPAHGCRSHPQ